MFVLWILTLWFTATVTGQVSSYVTVRELDEVTLPCAHLKTDHDKCQHTNWTHTDSENLTKEQLVRHGRIRTSERHGMIVLGNCSLVLKKGTVNYAGRYTCRHQGGESVVQLSVVHITEHRIGGTIYFYCSVSTHKHCAPLVKWLHHRNDVFTDHKDIRASETLYYATVSPLEPQLITAPLLDSLKCEVTDCDSRVYRFPLRPPPSVKVANLTATRSAEPTAESAGNVKILDSPTLQGLWRVVIVSVGLATLTFVVVMVNIWTRIKGNKTKTNQNTVRDDEDEDEGEVLK